MVDAIVITPVKDSLETTIRTISSVSKAIGNFEYFVFNDFSQEDTKNFLNTNISKYNYQLINLEEVTTNPSPNYNLVLQMAQQKAIEKDTNLIIIESDVEVQKNTISELIELVKKKKQTGLIGAITVDENGSYNFPYEYEKKKTNHVINTNHSLSFCCTIMSAGFLKVCDFKSLSTEKDWYDIHISRQSKKLGFNNFLAKNLEVLHKPHSSRPWKNLKYTHPLKYYWYKFIKRRDRI